MLKSRLVIFIILLTLIASSFGISQQNKETKTILIILGLAPNQPAYIPILNGIREKLDEKYYEDYNLYMEYLDLRRYPNGNFPKELFDSFNKKYRNIHIDLLICLGLNAVPTIKKFAESYLLELPTISMDLDFSDYGYVSDLRLNDKTTIVNMKLDPAKSIGFDIQLFPETSSVYFFAGISPLDKLFLSIGRTWAEKNLSNKKVHYITGLRMQELLKIVRKLPKQSVVFVGTFNLDADSVEYNNPDAIRLISSQSNSPVFGYSEMGIGDGPVGGYVASFESVGQFLGNAAIKILNGADPNSIKITEQDYYKYLFDWRQLKKWKLINSNLIPAGSTIMYEDISFVDKYKWVGGLVLLFVVLQTFLIANLIRLNKNQKVMTKKIIDTENKYKDFLHQDRSLRLGQLTASLSHEINQPLTAILSNAQAGIRFIDSGEGDLKLLKQIFQKIVESDKRGASIIRSIRGMMKPNVSEKRKVELNNLINEVIAVYQNETSRKNIILNTNLWNESIFVLADRIQIQQVLLNLISNAEQSLNKVTHTNKVISISSSVFNSEVSVKVRDNGTGIDASIMEKLFEPFVTSKNTGMGIGLTISQSIIEDHQGKIWAENLPEGGAEFSFTLKLFANGKK